MTDPIDHTPENPAARRFDATGVDPGDPGEEWLTSLRPAFPSAALMARLVAAKPIEAKPAHVVVRGTGARSSRWRRVLWIGGVGAAAAWVAAAHWTAPRDQAATMSPASVASLGVEADPSQVFLPVESTRTLVFLEPMRVVQQPDEPLRRYVRAVWVDDVTAVGAENDAALHLRRTQEAIVPVSSPVY